MTTVEYIDMSKDEFTAAVVANFPYNEAFNRNARSIVSYVQEHAPEASFPSAGEWHGFMKRAIEKDLRGGGPTPLEIDAYHGRGDFSHRSQAYVGSLAASLFVTEVQQVNAV